MGDARSIAPVSLLCATWNVGATLPQDSLGPWLRVTKDLDTMPKIYVIALQEIVELNTFNVVGPNRSSYAWESCIQDALGDSYTLVANEQRVGLLLLVYVHTSVQPWVSRIQSSNRAVGVLGIAANKAGVAVRFRLYDTSMCFVAAHFTAHTEKLVSRNADFHTIVNAIQFPDPRNVLKPVSIMENDCVFWLGDLNYRLEIPLSKLEEVHQLIVEEKYDVLLKHDQLITAMQNGKAFEGFKEGEITFAPTYKYEPRSLPLAYERMGSGGKEVRMPAWCDRVLYSTPKGNTIVTQQSYGRTDMCTSDHVPVMSEFRVTPTMLDSATNFLGGAFYAGIGWEIVSILHFLVLTTQLCVPLDDSYVKIMVNGLAWTTGGSATGLHVVANQLANAALPGASSASDTYQQVTSDVNCNMTHVGMPRFACFAHVEPPHLFLVVLFNYLLLLVILSLLALLWQMLRISLFRFHKFWRLFRKRQVAYTLIAAILKFNSLGMCAFTTYSIFQLLPGNFSSLSGLAIAFLAVQLGFLAWFAWRGGPKHRYMRSLRSASERMKYGFLYSDYKQKYRLFGLFTLLVEFSSGCVIGALSPPTLDGVVSLATSQVQLGILVFHQLAIFCFLMVTQPFVSIHQFWMVSLTALIKVAILAGLLIWSLQGMDSTNLSLVGILLGVGCCLLVLCWATWFGGLQARIYALSCQARCCRSSDFDKVREKREYEESKASVVVSFDLSSEGKPTLQSRNSAPNDMSPFASQRPSRVIGGPQAATILSAFKSDASNSYLSGGQLEMSTLRTNAVSPLFVRDSSQILGPLESIDDIPPPPDYFPDDLVSVNGDIDG